MKTPINVMLVDDHAVVRFGFRMLLDATEDIRVVAEAESAEVANLVVDVLEAPADEANLARVREKVAVLCSRFPVYQR